MQKPTAYKVMSIDEFDRLRNDGVFIGSASDVAHGFIHLSTCDQLQATANKHFSGRSDLFLVTVDLARLGGSVRWEPSRSGQLYPHIYGTLPLAAVISAERLEVADDGTIKLSG